ncbi:M16 family metallopeptidase [Flavobacterium poyangense]|uniref:M16 family metallopeptidase n=1 Tax=Flavobacterium poyangense TaxID=2204302 RepID=UPI0014244DBF|nr:M16 family metallopeptidase [Flavobacterium sp. JXAS1]
MRNTTYLFLFSLSLISSLTYGQSSTTSLPVSKQVVIDSLDNGLQYIIHPTSQAKVEYRMVLNVGSLQEKQNEKGYAHFLEHMVFNGSEDFPKWQAIDTLQTLGYRYGRDINAYTTYERTVYQLSLQKTVNPKLALNIFSNFLSKAELNDEAIEKERKIVIQEIKDFGQETAINQKKLEGTKQQQHLPIAREQDILILNRQQLIDFYKKWYAPNLATLIVTGNIDPVQVQKEIKAIFEKTKPTTRGKRSQNIYSFNPSFANSLLQEKSSTSNKAKLELIRFTKSPLTQTKEDFKQLLTASIYTNYINQKIKQTSLKTNYHAIWYLSNRTENTFELEAKTKKELLKKVDTLATLINTIKQVGISETELATIKSTTLARFNTSSNDDATFLADAYVDQAAAFSNYIDAKEREILAKEMIVSITSNDILQLHCDMWLKENNNLYLLTEMPQTFGKINEKNIKKTWNKGLTKQLSFTPSIEKKEDVIVKEAFTWRDLPAKPFSKEPAYLKNTKYYENIDVTQLTLSNGLRIAIKPTKSDDKSVVLSLATRNGFNLLSDQEYPYYQDTSYFVDSSWIKGMTEDEYTTQSSDKEISTLVNIAENVSTVNTMIRTTNLEDLFEWSYRKMFDYEMPKQDFDEYIAQEIGQSSQQKKEPGFMRIPSIQLDHKIANYKKTAIREQKELSTIAEWKRVNLNDMFSFYDKIVAQSQDNFLVISGNVNVEEITKMAIKYFGNIPANTTKLTTTPNEVFTNNSLQTKEIRREKIITDDIERPATTIIFKGKINAILKEFIIAQIVREVFNDAFLKRSRENEGLVYSPSTDIQIDLYPITQTAISLSFSASEKDIPTLEDIAKSVILELQSNRIDNSLLNRMKRTILTNKTMHLNDNATSEWVEKIREVYLNYADLNDFNNYNELLNSITTDEIKDVANTLFDSTNYGVFTLSPK